MLFVFTDAAQTMTTCIIDERARVKRKEKKKTIAQVNISADEKTDFGIDRSENH